ncbi:MAG: nucleotide exchange factor GrpE [Dethiobacter sp.]|jgi:molecular chaperone GrpE (heat shock protein)|nr:nucleotide exchange factor GrpE [Dethiobacter sp.]
MIDFRKELDNFDFSTIDSDFSRHFNEAAQVIKVFNSTLRRLGKEMSNTNIQLEEVLSQFMEEKEKDRYIAEQQKSLAAREEEKLSLVHGLVAVFDQLEDIYRYALKNERGGWSEQMQLLWRDTAAILLRQGIVRIECEDTPFDSQLHSAVQVREDSSIASGMVTEVLRCGYMFQSLLLRKAQVTVNKTGGGRECDEQHSGD